MIRTLRIINQQQHPTAIMMPFELQMMILSMAMLEPKVILLISKAVYKEICDVSMENVSIDHDYAERGDDYAALICTEESLVPLQFLTKLTRLRKLVLTLPDGNADLSPLKCLVNLETLELKDVPAEASLESLVHLKKLECLDICNGTYSYEAGYVIINVDPLAEMVSLTSLTLKFVTVDFASISKMTNLQYIDMSYSECVTPDLNLLRSMTNLMEIDISYSNIGSLAGIQHLKQLEVIQCEGNEGIDDVTPLAALTNLQHLTIFETSVRSLRPISNLVGLRVLWDGASDTIIINGADSDSDSEEDEEQYGLDP